MRWVKETLPPRARARWLLMTVRLSQSSLTGTERTDVAVGTASEASMFWAVRAGAPRRTVYVGSSLAAAGAASLLSLGTGVVVPFAGSAAWAAWRGLATRAGFCSVFCPAAGSAFGAASAGLAAVFAGAGRSWVRVVPPWLVP